MGSYLFKIITIHLYIYYYFHTIVLILDVARFKYPPHWVPIDIIFKAMLTIDKSSQKQRGYIILSKSDKPSLGRIMRPIINDVSHNWKDLMNTFYLHLSNLLKTKSVNNIEDYVNLCLETIDSTNLEKCFMSYQTDFDNIPKEHQDFMELVFNNIRDLKLFKLIRNIKLNNNSSAESSLTLNESTRNNNNDFSMELMTLFLLSYPIDSLQFNQNLSQDIIDEINDIFNPKDLLQETKEEIQSLRLSLESLKQIFCNGLTTKCHCKDQC